MSRSEPRRIALFIEGAKLHATAGTLGFDIDYKRLLREFQSRPMRWNSPGMSMRSCCSPATAISAPLVAAVQRRGARVTVISTIRSEPPMIADELHRQADVFIDLAELQSTIGRDPSQRAGGRDGLDRLSRGRVSETWAGK